MTNNGNSLSELLPIRKTQWLKTSTAAKPDLNFASIFEKRIQEQLGSANNTEAYEPKDRGLATKVDRSSETRISFRGQKTQSKSVQRMKDSLEKIERSIKTLQSGTASEDDVKTAVKDLKDALREMEDVVKELQSSEEDETISLSPELAQVFQLLDTLKQLNAGAELESGNRESTVVMEQIQLGTEMPLDQLSKIIAESLKGIVEVLDKEISQLTQVPIEKMLKEDLQEILYSLETIGTEEVEDGNTTGKLEALLEKLNAVEVKVESKPAEQVASAVVSNKPQEQVTQAPDRVVEEKPQEEQVPVVQTSADTATKDSSTKDGNQPEQFTKQPEVAVNLESKVNGETETKETKAVKIAGVEANQLKPMVEKNEQNIQMNQGVKNFSENLESVQNSVQNKTQVQNRVMEQVLENVKTNFNIDGNRSEMLIKLKPESLGQVSLKVSVENGILKAEFQVESQAVKQALESNLQDLRNALQDKGFNVFDLNVSVRKDNHQQNGRQQQRRGNRSNGISKIEAVMGQMEKRISSLEAIEQESVIDQLG